MWGAYFSRELEKKLIENKSIKNKEIYFEGLLKLQVNLNIDDIIVDMIELTKLYKSDFKLKWRESISKLGERSEAWIFKDDLEEVFELEYWEN